MAKKDRKLMQELLSKALEPPRKPMSKERLDSLLEDYDDGQPLSKTITSDLKSDQPDLEQQSNQKDQFVSIDILASLAKPAIQARPMTSLANQTTLDTMARLANQTRLNTPTSIDILASLKNVAGYLQLSNTLIDSLFPQLSPDETVTYLHLYRLSWGFNNSTCIISLPALSKRTSISPRQVQRVLLSLENKSLIKKEGSIFGKGQIQGNIFRVAKLTSLANVASQDTKASLASMANIKDDDHDDLKKQDHHQSEHEKRVMMIYQETTRNSWTKADSTTYNKIKNIPLQAIEIAIKLATQRASSPPNSLAYFVKEIINTANPPKQNRTQRKKALEKIVQQVRNSFIGGNYSVSDFTFKVKEVCLREDVGFDNDIFDEIMSRKNP